MGGGSAARDGRARHDGRALERGDGISGAAARWALRHDGSAVHRRSPGAQGPGRPTPGDHDERCSGFHICGRDHTHAEVGTGCGQADPTRDADHAIMVVRRHLIEVVAVVAVQLHALKQHGRPFAMEPAVGRVAGQQGQCGEEQGQDPGHATIGDAGAEDVNGRGAHAVAGGRCAGARAGWGAACLSSALRACGGCTAPQPARASRRLAAPGPCVVPVRGGTEPQVRRVPLPRD